MRDLFPSFTYRRMGGPLTWRGPLQPRERSPLYDVRIARRNPRPPQVTVVRPALDPRAPHRYPNGSLCLYYPKDQSWHPSRYIAETIVPWTAEWLLFYELWQETGTWWGPEAPHGDVPKRAE